MKNKRRIGKLYAVSELFEGNGNSVIQLCTQMNRLEYMWNCVVGDALFARSRPIKLEYDQKKKITLYILVSSAIALQNMNFKRSHIIQSIFHAIHIWVDHIEFKMGKIPCLSRVTSTESRKCIKCIQIDENRVKEIMQELFETGISDIRLAHALARYRFLCERRHK